MSLLIAFGLVVLSIIIFYFLYVHRVHLPNSVSNLRRRFQREREHMFLSLFDFLGWTAEFHGTLVTSDPQLTQHLFMDPGHNQNRSRWYKFSSRALPGMHGVLNMEGEEWKEYTRVLLPIFHATNVEKFCNAMTVITSRHVTAWKQSITAEGGVLPKLGTGEDANEQFIGGGACLLEAIRGISMDILFQWAYSLDMHDGKNTQLQEKSQLLAKSLSNYGNIVGVLAQKPLALVGNYISLMRETWNMRKIVGEIVDDLGIFQGDAGSTTPNLFSRLIKKLSQIPNIPTLTSAVNHVHGAHKAAGFVLLHALHELCQPSSETSDSEIQNLENVGGTWWRDRLREEWKERNFSGMPLSLSDVTEGKLPLTQAVLWEVQRLHPVSLGVVRRTGLPLQIRDTLLPPGCEVVVLLQALHTNPLFWTKPMEFRPDRWLTHEALTVMLKRAAKGPGVVNDKSGCIVYNIRERDFAYEPSNFTGSALSSVLGADRNRMEGTWPVATNTGAMKGMKSRSNADSGDSDTLSFRLTPPKSYSPTTSDGTILAPPYSFVPFLYGVRMCAGKILAEMELFASLIGILEKVNLNTEVEYFAHVHDIPVCTGAGQAKKMRESLPPFTPDHINKGNADPVQFKESYSGRMFLRLEDDMYAGVAGVVPFTVTTIH